jgi:hypothetical protein
LSDNVDGDCLSRVRGGGGVGSQVGTTFNTVKTTMKSA